MLTAVEQTPRLPANQVFTFGQVLVQPLKPRGFRLCHRDDSSVTEKVSVFRSPEDALEIAREDDEGNYRSLKTAPTLRHGWQLEVANETELHLALDLFYPGRLAVLKARDENRLQTTALRETLGRQTGMYRIAANISDEQLDCLIADFCRSDSGCLRTILWKRDNSGTIPSTKLPPEKFDPGYDQAAAGGADPVAVVVPLLCQEACNLFVAECRKVVKGERTAH
jgi:sirohydrochlorin cobaltochelatase